HLHNIIPPKDPKEIRPSVNYDVICRPLLYLKGMIYMNQVYETMNLDRDEFNQIRQFQCLPLRTSISPKNILLDTRCIIEYFYEELKHNYVPEQIRTFSLETGKPGVIIRNYPMKTHMSKHIEENRDIIWR